MTEGAKEEARLLEAVDTVNGWGSRTGRERKPTAQERYATFGDEDGLCRDRDSL